DGHGGAFLASTVGGHLEQAVQVLHVDSSSVITSSWGMWLSWGIGPVMCSDDSGGGIVAWRTDGIAMRRVPVDPANPGWWGAARAWGSDRTRHGSGGPGGALAVWLDSPSGSPQSHAQPVTRRGPAPGWPGGGLLLSPHPADAGMVRYIAGAAERYSSVASDGS